MLVSEADNYVLSYSVIFYSIHTHKWFDDIFVLFQKRLTDRNTLTCRR